jgi:hypothetical protein
VYTWQKNILLVRAEMLVSFCITGFTKIPIAISFVATNPSVSRNCVKKRYYTLNTKAFVIGHLPELLQAVDHLKNYLMGKNIDTDLLEGCTDLEYEISVDFDNIMYTYVLKISKDDNSTKETLSKTTDTEIFMTQCTPMMGRIKTWLLENLITDRKRKIRDGNVLFCDQPKELMPLIKEDKGQILVVTNQMLPLEYSLVGQECIFVLDFENIIDDKTSDNTVSRCELRSE